MTMVNVTVDDFDPLVGYSNYDDWQTPNPQDNPTWFNASSDVTKSPWHEGECDYPFLHFSEGPTVGEEC